MTGRHDWWSSEVSHHRSDYRRLDNTNGRGTTETMASDPGSAGRDDEVIVEPVAARAALDWQAVDEASSGLVVPVPEGWEPSVDPAEVAIISLRPAACPAAGPGLDDNDFRPNVTVTVERPPPAPDQQAADLDVYSRQLIAGLFRYLTDAHVVSVDPETFGGYDGRHVISGHRQGPFTLVTEQYWSIAPTGVATVLTGTCTLEQYRWASNIFEQVAMGTTTATSVPEGEST